MSASLHQSAVLKRELSEVFVPLRHKGSLPNLRQKSSEPGRLEQEQSLSKKLEQLKSDSSKKLGQASNDLQAQRQRPGSRRQAQVQVSVDGRKTRDSFAYIFEKPVALLRSSVQAYMDLQRVAPPAQGPASVGRPQQLLHIWGEQQLAANGSSLDTLMR